MLDGVRNERRPTSARRPCSGTGSGRRLYVAATLALLAVGLSSGAAQAQGIIGTVRHQSTGEPLPGVLVSVIGPGGERVRAVLTDGTGGFTVEVPMGRYQLRAERIGLRTEMTDTFDLNTFNMRFQRIEMAARAIEIAGLVVDSRVQSCRLDPQKATRLQRWWSEIRTALDVSAALQREQFGRFLVEKFDREWDKDLREIIASNRRFEVSVSTRPFVSASAQELADEGFVQGDPGPERLYYGPDADVLLSSVFLTQHCFSLVEERDRDHQLGLHFEPVEGREVADIEGTLWVDTVTSELTDLDFRYVNFDGPEGDDAGGNIVFEYLPSGAWIVSDWYIRIPKTSVLFRRVSVIGYFDGGGSVTPLSPPEPGGAVGSIRGLVADSLRGGGLGGAVVTLLGTSRQTLTDDDGRFGFFEVPVGSHYVGFFHDELDTWGLGSGYVQVDLREGGSADVTLFVPSFEQVALALCMGRGVDAETVVVVRVLGPDRDPRPGERIRLAYELPRRRGGRMVQLNFRTDESGRFVVCSIPGGKPVTIRANLGGEWADITDFTPQEGEVTYREIWFTR